MSRDPAATFEEKRALVALFREQVALLREADPDGLGRGLEGIDFQQYDDLLAQGPGIRWPAGLLPGLREGIRDAFAMLELSYPASARAAAWDRLRAAAGSVAGLLEARDAKQLARIRKRGRIRTEDEYHLVRAHVDRLEGQRPQNDALLRELWRLVDDASPRDAV